MHPNEHITRKAAVGVLMLETRFPRILGDIGHAQTWPFPVHYKVIRGATPDNVVCRDPQALVNGFIQGGRELVAKGCAGITTSCGFLILLQDRIQQALGVPVATSFLMQIPLVQATLPPCKKVGVITISASNLSEDHFRAAGAPPDTPVIGTEHGRCFSKTILTDAPTLDVAAARLDLVEAARDIKTRHKDLGAIVLECTNMAPYAADIALETGLPVYTIYSFISWFQSGLAPRRFIEETH